MKVLMYLHLLPKEKEKVLNQIREIRVQSQHEVMDFVKLAFSNQYNPSRKLEKFMQDFATITEMINNAEREVEDSLNLEEISLTVPKVEKNYEKFKITNFY